MSWYMALELLSRVSYYVEMEAGEAWSRLKIGVIVPAYNEAATVAKVVQGIRQQLPESVVAVIDDGSSDDTPLVAKTAGAFVLRLPFNLGIGGAVQTGLKYAERSGFDVTVEIDADGQHDPGRLRLLVDMLVDSQTDMVIGSRFAGIRAYRASWLRLFGIRLFSLLIKLVTGARVYDSTSGYRAYNRRAVAFLARQYPADFPEPESIVMLLNAGFRIQEMPMDMNSRQGGQSVIGRHDLSWRAAYFVLSNAIAILVSGLKEKRVYVD